MFGNVYPNLLAIIAGGTKVYAGKDAGIFDFLHAAEKLPKERFTPSNESEVMLKRVFSPRRFESTAAAAPLKHEWADGYSGFGGSEAAVSTSDLRRSPGFRRCQPGEWR
jgi:hypothetical protein